ncbi:ABC transporter permease [Fulvivirga sediminis]|uniref:ABC transporter permease n=1 Tax=Fulvivirga sediminis TaxID=2803949 RepID=A0A937K2C8_9BACT|nr:ABC transporter permease [Fulvivirga sediminis]MBL3658451.1 ABC transporter permease [Fulvivirga sediminis]
MLKNYLLVTIRNLLKNRVYSFINITGLAIGIACSVLILLWVKHETSFDKFIPKHDRLYQVWVHAEFDGKINSWRSIPLPTYEAVKDRQANIVNSAVTSWGATHLLSWKDTRFNKDGHAVSEEFLEMFEYPLLQGDASTVLDEPYSIVITESLAQSLFGDEEPMGKLVRIDDEHELKVTGILKDIPDNSSFEFEYLYPWKFKRIIEPWVEENEDNWGNYSFQVFLELDDADHELTANEAVAPLLTENGQEDMPRSLFLHPMADWRLNSNFENGVAKGGMNDYVKLFTIIAVFILLIACINFMNLATARSERRAKEVGVRKSVGSGKMELVLQFIGESIFITLISFVLAILLAQLILPLYNQLVEKELFIDYLSGEFWTAAIAFILLVGIVAGSYPAFYLSSFQPVKVLKGKVKVGKNGSTPRKVLVTLQFGFAILLIIGTAVIYKQIQLVQSRDLGYNQENLLTIPMNNGMIKNYRPLKLELLNSGVVESVTKSNSSITSITSNNFLSWPGKPEELRVIFTTIAADYDYTKTMGIKVLEGRDFSEDFKSDSSAIVINKAALDIMGLEDPIGTQLDLWGEKRTLIGVVDNTLMGSPYDPIKPMFIVIDRNWSDNLVTVRLNKTDDLKASLAQVQGVFEKYNPAYPFEYRFVDEDFAKKFTTINLTSRLAGIFATLAIIITGLGLFGLASFTAEQRTKEIGIRKVLGASVGSLVALISSEFSRLVIISFIISAPLAWWLLNSYLDRYPIRTNIDWWVFPLTGFIALSFAVIIVANQAWGAARSNPVKSLRSE